MDAARGARTEPGGKGLQDLRGCAVSISQRCAAACGRYVYNMTGTRLSYQYEGWLEPTAKLGSRITAFAFAKPQVASHRVCLRTWLLFFCTSLYMGKRVYAHRMMRLHQPVCLDQLRAWRAASRSPLTLWKECLVLSSLAN